MWRATRILLRADQRLRPWYGRLAGLGLGLLGSWYGAAAGFLLGTMVDALRTDLGLRSFLAHPEIAPRRRTGIPAETRGWSLSAVLALGLPWPDSGGYAERQAVLLEVLTEADGPGGTLAPGLLRHLESHQGETAPPLAAFSRELALLEEDGPRILLARFAYTNAWHRLSGQDLPFETDRGIALLLTEAGIPGEVQTSARAQRFPGYRDPWALLGLEPGADRARLRAAWRRTSKSLHPDHGLSSGAEFLRAKAAYDHLLEVLQGCPGRG